MKIRISTELSHVCPLDEITRHAIALETHGFHRVWVPDTVVSPWEAWLAASIIMQHTSRIQIGLGVTNPYTRHPVVVAEMASAALTSPARSAPRTVRLHAEMVSVKRARESTYARWTVCRRAATGSAA